jgi:hypothetical protein
MKTRFTILPTDVQWEYATPEAKRKSRQTWMQVRTADLRLRPNQERYGPQGGFARPSLSECRYVAGLEWKTLREEAKKGYRPGDWERRERALTIRARASNTDDDK